MKILVSSKMSSGKIKDKINQKIAQTAGALIGVVKPEKQVLLPRNMNLVRMYITNVLVVRIMELWYLTCLNHSGIYRGHP